MNRPFVVALILVMGLSACSTRPKSLSDSAPAPAQATSEESRPEGAAPEGAASLSALQAAFGSEAGDRVYFPLDSHTLSPEAEAGLARQAAWLARRPEVTVLIEGNCDERGTREYNLALGARRAGAVHAYLISHGVGAARLRTISYGKERPLDPEASEAAWARNRNAHTVLIDLVAR